MRISDALVEKLLKGHKVAEEQLNELKQQAKSEKKPLQDLVVKSNLLTEKDLTKLYAEEIDVSYVELNAKEIKREILRLIPERIARQYNAVVLGVEDDGSKLLAMEDPDDVQATNFLQKQLGTSLKVHIATSSNIQTALDQYRGNISSELTKVISPDEEEEEEGEEVSEEDVAEDSPIAQTVNLIIDYAVRASASDIHIEPREEYVLVRYRVDGILREANKLPKKVLNALVSRIKILSNLKIDERRAPQDGRFNFKVSGQEVDLRISVLPTSHGEKIVMRLLRKTGGIPSLAELGLAGSALKVLETNILRPHGIIIVCGPTGSGKTTTLYSVLNRLNTPKVNIMSLEDPVEYELAGINQVQINPAVGLTFASGLRSFLRQDPNIILVGEIRDEETGDLALQAALTGHLVFSTLHTSNAAGVLPRLIDLGAEKFLLASTMNAMVGQRIVRKICQYCKQSYPPPPQLIEEMKVILGNFFPQIQGEAKLYKGKGCEHCGDSGYSGRVGIFEVMGVSEKVGQLILEHPDSASIEKQAIAEGMITMRQDGYLKVLSGTTTIEEVLRVAQE